MPQKGFSRRQQIRLCHKVAESEDRKDKGMKFYGPKRWRHFISYLRKTDIVILPQLLVINDKSTPEVQDPGALFEHRIKELVQACLYVVDATGRDGVTGMLKSTDEGWHDHVRKNFRYTVLGIM